MDTTTVIDPTELPAALLTYLAAHTARDVDIAMAHYAPDAVVVDEDHAFEGVEEIRGWFGSAASEYTYTTELIGASRIDDEHYDAVHHLEGDFPGGVVDLHFRFTLRDGLIQRLVIEP